ncbi:MAG: hypothetical protein V1914_02190 [archaeon]
MAFLKTAVASISLLLASSAYAQGDGQEKEHQLESTMSLEQLLKTSEIAAWKVAAEKGLILEKAEVDKFKDWNIRSIDAGCTATGVYKVPNWTTLNMNGLLSGKDLELNLNTGDIFYGDLNLNDMVTSSTWPISLGGANVTSILEDLEKGNGVEGMAGYFSDLEGDLEDIYKDKYTNELFLGLLLHMSKVLPEYSADNEMTVSEYSKFGKDMEEFLDEFYQEGVDSEDKKRTMKALEDFVAGMHKIDIVGVFEYITDKVYNDPMNEISIGGKTLKELAPLFEKLKPILNFKESEKGVTLNWEIKGKGRSEISILSRYDLGLGKEFVQSFTADNQIFGSARIYFNLNLSKGEPIYIYLPDNNLKLPLEALGNLLGFHLHLLDLDIDGSMFAEYRLKTNVLEGYQLSEATTDGRKGYGFVLDSGMSSLEGFSLEVQARVDSHEDLVSFSFSQSTKLEKQMHESLLFYAFREGEYKDLWYHLSLGVKPHIEQRIYQGRRQSLSFKSTLVDVLGRGMSKIIREDITLENPDPNLHFNIMPEYSLVFGVRGKIISPFFSYKSPAEELVRVGMILDTGPVVSKFYLQSSEEGRLSLESAVILLDENSNMKLTDYYVRAEQIAAAAQPGKLRELTNAQAKLYSNLSGVLLSGKLLDESYMFRVVLGSENVYMGATYFGNYDEEMYGLGVLFGYRDFSIGLEGGMSELYGMHSQQLTASIGGKIDNVSIYLDLQGSTWPFRERCLW